MCLGFEITINKKGKSEYFHVHNLEELKIFFKSYKKNVKKVMDGEYLHDEATCLCVADWGMLEKILATIIVNEIWKEETIIKRHLRSKRIKKQLELYFSKLEDELIFEKSGKEARINWL